MGKGGVFIIVDENASKYSAEVTQKHRTTTRACDRTPGLCVLRERDPVLKRERTMLSLQHNPQ